ncbi:hypothetical protein K488DRAFT_87813 [Vararia minispora EC-137]|uniref:Uncharacterized protein n=1 Tax=Vararia minispora EC-137 TaxID=1314806 RepID=A0ACB8QFD0_9AGAM|nr:hypothetical protein K488DRAFT_87813 [Vararia minispora EC-137]
MSPQNKEAAAFIARIAKLPNGPVSLDDALQPSLDDEAELRKLFAMDKSNARLKDLFVGLVDVFDAPEDIRTTRSRVVKDDDDLFAQYVMPLTGGRRRPEGAPSTVEDLDAFKKNWSIFTEGSLSQLSDWNNVVAAGGSVMACLAPLPADAKESKRTMRQYFHETAYKSSDVDLFLYGLTPEQAEAKIISIYEAVRDSVPWDVTCVRTRHTVSIHSQYPYRCIQIVLRLYSSPAEILAGFDVDAPCFLYDGHRVWGNPRAIVAMMRQANTVDMTRRSPSYEIRLAKYSLRDLEIYIPNLKRKDIDPTACCSALCTYSKGPRKYHSDFKSTAEFSDIEMSDYDVVVLQIPYGPGWHAKRIEKLVYKTDLGMNSPWNPRNEGRRLHRHPAFFGTMQECLDDCCGDCPEPGDKEEHELQDEQDKSYVRDRISFIQEDPGRQSISGSFNPIDEGEWCEQAYIQAKAKLFNAIALGDLEEVSQMIADGEPLDVRDQVGRTPLHVAIISGNEAVAIALIDAGARMTPRLVGGRSSLHLAAQYGQVAVVKKMLDRSALNAQKAEEAKKAAEAEAIGVESESESERPSSEDDWSSEESDGEESKPRRGKDVNSGEIEKPAGDPLEDNAGEPDVLDISLPDWDFAFTPLGYAILSGSVELVQLLLAAGADATQPTKAKQGQPLHPLTMTLFTPDELQAACIVEHLLAAGASSSAANNTQYTIFHRAVSSNRPKIVSALLHKDPNATSVRDFPAWLNYFSAIVYPVVTAIQSGDYSTVAILVAHGAKLSYTPEDVSRAEDHLRRSSSSYLRPAPNFRERLFLPVETAIANMDEIVYLLLALGAPSDVPVKQSITRGQIWQTLANWAACAANHLSGELRRRESGTNVVQELVVAPSTSWAEERAALAVTVALGPMRQSLRRGAQVNAENMTVKQLERARDYFLSVEKSIRERPKENSSIDQHRTGALLHPVMSQTTALAQPSTTLFHAPLGGRPSDSLPSNSFPSLTPPTPATSYIRIKGSYQEEPVPLHLKAFYDELYEACWDGDNARIEELCLPKKVASDSQEPIQITVRTTSPKDSYSHAGYTPLYVAVHRRRWSTARLIMAIALAQYKPAENEPKTFNVDDYVEEDSDNDDTDEADDDDYEAPINFKDIAHRPSSVQCDTPPSRLLSMTGIWPNTEGDAYVTDTLLNKAIRDGDFEAFVNIADIYRDHGVELGRPAISTIMTMDNTDMLDEYIRRTGDYLPIISAKPREEPVSIKKAKGLQEYRGLNVGGRKRQDLSSRGKSTQQPQWRAIWQVLLKEAATGGAVKAVEYLAGPRPLAAYRHYAENSTDDNAQLILETKDLQAVLPTWLGWEINELNESAMTCAILAGKFEVVKKLVEIEPKLMTDALLVKSKFVGFTGLLAAAYAGVEPELFNYLLKHGSDPEERDVRGLNILHLACTRGHDKLVKHMVNTLSSDLFVTLLGQISKGGQNTPLLLAVKAKNLRVVDALTSFAIPPEIYLMKDSSGSSALHVAVQNSLPSITELLVKRGPVSLLHAENGVGQTPLDIASLQELTARSALGHGDAGIINALPTHLSGISYRLRSAASRNAAGTRLRRTLDALLDEGVLTRGISPAVELFAFAERLETTRPGVAEAEDEDEDADADADAGMPQGFGVQHTPHVNTNVAETFAIMRAATSARPGARQLVHILDVQRSVERNIAQVSQPVTHPRTCRSAYRRLARARFVEEPGEDESQKLKAWSVYWGQRSYLSGEGQFMLFDDVDGN